MTTPTDPKHHHGYTGVKAMSNHESTKPGTFIDRETATKLNPLISGMGYRDTLSMLSSLVTDLGYFVAISDGENTETHFGNMHLICGVIAAALDFEADTAAEVKDLRIG
jgi:hypothetical protein